MLNPADIQTVGKDLSESAKLNPELKKVLDKRELKNLDLWDGPMPPVPGQRPERRWPDVPTEGYFSPAPGQQLERGVRTHLPAEGNGLVIQQLHQMVDGVRDHLPAEDNGHWEGERGDGKWYPSRTDVPRKSNPDNLTWGEILDKYGLDGIRFENGEPDFKDVCKEEVTIEGFSTNRADNFDKADKAAAEKRGCTPEEVAQWRKEHGYTWHEMKDMKTMQKVPSDLHNNIPHSGGIANKKAQEGGK